MFALDISPPLIRSAPAATVPGALAAGQWTAENAGTGGALVVAIVMPPDTGGSPITAYQYRIDGGAWTAFDPALASTGSPRTISGLTDAVEVDIEVRAVNAIGAGPASDVKARTPTSSFTAPAFVGASSYFNDTGDSLGNYELALPVGSLAGDLIVISNPRLTSSSPNPPAGCATVEAINRLSATNGANYNWGVWSKLLTPTDISNGHIAIPNISRVTAVGALVFRNALGAAVYTDDNYHRSSDLDENSVALRQETPATAAPDPIAVALAVRGGGLRETTFPAGWTARLDVMDPVWPGPGRVAVHACTRVVSGESPADTLAFSGAADMNIITLTLIIEGVPA